MRVLKDWLTAVLWLGACAPLAAQSPSGDSVVFVGVGQSGSWITEMVMTNADDLNRLVLIGPSPGFGLGPCPDPCGHTIAEVAASGTAQIDPEIIQRITQTSVTTLYVTPEPEAQLPSVRSRVFNTVNAVQAMEIPGIRLSTILAANPDALSFPGTSRSETVRTNLILTNVRRFGEDLGPSVTLRIEAFSPDGQSLGTADVMLEYGETRFLVDVLSSPLQVPALSGGQIRVTRISGTGVYWGTQCVTDIDGTLRVSVGRNP